MKKDRDFNFIYSLVLIILFEVFYIGCFVYLLIISNFSGALLAFGMMILTILPTLASKLFNFTINSFFLTFLLLYFLAGFLGHGFAFYELLPWWDNMLHFLGGVAFFLIGVYLVIFINKKNNTSLLTKALFGLFFSISLAAFWEFIEYGTDFFFSTDMQNDTYINSINSYLLGGDYTIGHIDDIKTVIVNGVVLEGYIDIGLIDTMTDMLYETLGAFIFFIIFLIEREKHPLIKFKNIINEN